MCTLKLENPGLKLTTPIRGEKPFRGYRDGGPSGLGVGTQPGPEWALSPLS